MKEEETYVETYIYAYIIYIYIYIIYIIYIIYLYSIVVSPVTCVGLCALFPNVSAFNQDIYSWYGSYEGHVDVSSVGTVPAANVFVERIRTIEHCARLHIYSIVP
jgi:hypothetical protein